MDRENGGGISDRDVTSPFPQRHCLCACTKNTVSIM